MAIYKGFFKRAIDVTASAGVLVVFSPVLLTVGVLLHFFNEGAGVFFLQERPGYKGKPFKIVKFKTMNERKDASAALLPDKQRITKFGAFLRNTSLDELPQLWNVLKGDMSLIGPRPLLMQYLPLYSAEQNRRHDVRPGITGWAQCHGRNHLTWADKFKLDVWYVDNLSFKTDCSIVMTTLKSVLKKENIESETSSKYTQEPFNGHN